MIVLLGPQRFRPTVVKAVGALGVRGAVAMVTAGWQEREGEDEELRTHLGRDVVNLRVYQRCETVFQEDPELFAAVRRSQDRLRGMQQTYRLRLDPYLTAVRHLLESPADPSVIEPEVEDALKTVRSLDAHHLARVDEIHREFDERWCPAERHGVARQRRELMAMLDGTEAVAVAGGHVMVLLNRLRLLDVMPLLVGRPIVAWSAGAMVLADKVVVFHDCPPQGRGHAEVLDAGLGLCPGVVPLPHARKRLRLGDAVRVSLLSRRFEPASCLTLDDGSWLDWGPGGLASARKVSRLTLDGKLEACVA